MRGGGQPVTFHVGPGAEPPGGPGSWGNSKVGIGWRQGVGGRGDTELLSNTWGAEGGGRFGGGGTGRMGVLGSDPGTHGEGVAWAGTPWPLTMAIGHQRPWWSRSSASWRGVLRTLESG